MGSLIRDLVTYPCQDACGEILTSARVEGAPVYRCPGCDSEWILLNERMPQPGASDAARTPDGAGSPPTPEAV